MKIIGTGSSVPNKTVSNDMLTGFLDTSDEWISTRTGIRSRQIITNETLEDLAIDAAEKAIQSSGITPDELEFIIVSNVANNFVTPSLSAIVQGAIGSNCPCIDLNGACAGFIYAMDIAEAYLRTDRAKNILILCAEEPTRFCDWHQRETSVLFGDGAGAVVATKGDNLRSIHLTTSSNRDVIYYKRKLESTPYEQTGVATHEPLVMRGREVFRIAVQSSNADLNYVMDKADVNADNIQYFLLHQANMRILEAIRTKLDQPESKFPTNIERYGNTSSASIPILLDELSRAGKIDNGSFIALSAFGAGFVTGAAILQWNTINY